MFSLKSIFYPLPHLPNMTSSPERFQLSDVELTVGILGYLAQLEELLPCDNLTEVVEIVGNLVAVNQTVLSQAANSSNRVIGYLESIASNVHEKTCNGTISSNNVHVNVHPLNPDDPNIQNGIYIKNAETTEVFFNASAEDLLKNMQNFEAGVVLPKSLLQKVSNTSKRVVYAVVPNINTEENVSTLSNVISVTVHNVSVYDLGREEVTLLFKLNSKLDNNEGKVECVYWDANLNAWSYKGCFVRNSSQGFVMCGCNHLTGFSVILRESVSRDHEEYLKYITYVGCSLSCVGFLMIMLTFLCFREWRKSLRNKCLFNFSLSYFLFLIIYMTGIHQTEPVWCKINAILLHFFLLSSFTWMVVLAFHLYISFVKILPSKITRLIQKAMAFAWGVPTIIVGIVLSADHESYPRKKICWLSSSVVLYAVIIPLSLMLIVNFIVFGIILYLRTCKPKLKGCNSERQKQIIIGAKASFIIFILLGLSWIFGIFILGSENNVQAFFTYLFTITTTLQGFLLAIFFIIRPSDTRQLWMKLFLKSTYAIKSHTSHVTSAT